MGEISLVSPGPYNPLKHEGRKLVGSHGTRGVIVITTHLLGKWYRCRQGHELRTLGSATFLEDGGESWGPYKWPKMNEQ